MFIYNLRGVYDNISAGRKLRGTYLPHTQNIGGKASKILRNPKPFIDFTGMEL